MIPAIPEAACALIHQQWDINIIVEDQPTNRIITQRQAIPLEEEVEVERDQDMPTWVFSRYKVFHPRSIELGANARSLNV
jgi:hypothetical protein